MRIHFAKSNTEFRELIRKYLLEFPIELQFFNVNTMNLDQDISTNNLRGIVYDDLNNPRLLFLDANPYNLLLFGIDNNLEVSKTLASYYQNKGILFKGIMGNGKDVKLFIESYGDKFTLKNAMDIMKLNKLTPQTNKGTLVRPTINDTNFLLTGIKNFYFEALYEEIADDKAIEMVNNYFANPYFFIYQNENKVNVGFAQFQKRGPLVNVISAVYIFDEYRGRGYAKEMTNLICLEALKEKALIALYVDKNNPISNHVYRYNGFEVLTDVYDYQLNK